MKKIAFLINSLGKGGAEHVAVNLAEHFQKEKYETLLVTSRMLPEEYKIEFPAKRRMLEEEITKNIRKGALGALARIPGMERALRAFWRIRQLERIWEEEKPDLILAFIGKMNLYGILSAKKSGIPVILSIRSDPEREYPSGAERYLAGRLFPRAAGIIFQTETAKRYFSEEIQKRSAVLPNPLDSSFAKGRYEGKRRDEIVMVGRLDANKNQAMLLRAFARIHKNYPSMKVRIYGAGLEGSDTGPELERLAGELGIENKVQFMGRVSHVREKIEKSRIFVLTSNYEGMPNALLEAMATGLCVISTDCPCGGPGSVIQDGKNGLLIPVGDEDALKDALERALEDPVLEERLGRAAAELAKGLAPEKVCRQWQEEIESRVCAYVSSQSQKKARR